MQHYLGVGVVLSVLVAIGTGCSDEPSADVTDLGPDSVDDLVIADQFDDQDGSAIEVEPLQAAVIQVRHSNIEASQTRWPIEFYQQAVFGDPADYPLAPLSVRHYWQEVSNGSVVITGSVDPTLYDLGVAVDECPPTASGQPADCCFQHNPDNIIGICNIQGGSGQEPVGRMLDAVTCAIGRALDAFNGCTPGDGCNWMGDRAEDLLIVSLSGVGGINGCWPGGYSDLQWQDLFGARVALAMDWGQFAEVNPFDVPETLIQAAQIALITHEVGHSLGFGHSNGLFCTFELDSSTLSPMPFADPFTRCTEYDARADYWIGDQSDIMCARGVWDFQLGTETYHGGHVNLHLKLHNNHSQWIDPDTVAVLQAGDVQGVESWHLVLAPAETQRGDPALEERSIGAILQVNQQSTFVLEFRRPASENSWSFDQFSPDDPLVNGLQVRWVVPPTGSDDDRYATALLLDCNPHLPYQRTQVPSDLYDFSDAACAAGQQMAFQILEEDGSLVDVQIDVEAIDTTPGDSWIEIEVTVQRREE